MTLYYTTARRKVRILFSLRDPVEAETVVYVSYPEPEPEPEPAQVCHEWAKVAVRNRT